MVKGTREGDSGGKKVSKEREGRGGGGESSGIKKISK